MAREDGLSYVDLFTTLGMPTFLPGKTSPGSDRQLLLTNSSRRAISLKSQLRALSVGQKLHDH